jgi:hypothetical protein
MSTPTQKNSSLHPMLPTRRTPIQTLPRPGPAVTWERESGVVLKVRMKYGTHTELQSFSQQLDSLFTPPSVHN